MKKILLTLCLAAAASTYAAAQIKTVTIKTPTVQCTDCKDKIENYLNRYDGVETVKVNVKLKQAVVKYRADRIDVEQIKAAIANAGYDADDLPANPDSYKALPKCCKKPEDGGGHSKQ